jgi:sulfite exporter TauE/SafE
MNLSEGFFLGLSTGAACLAYCGIVLIPFLMGEGKDIKRNTFYVFFFLIGRLIAYVLIGVFTGLLGKILLQPGILKTSLFGITYIVLAILLIVYGFHRFKEICLGKVPNKTISSFGKQWPIVIPFAGGIVTGINICPPFLIAIVKALETGNLWGSILFFVMFFLGTSLYFLPLPFIGFLKRQQVLRIVGRFAAILTGIIYLYKGMIMVLMK